MDVVVLGTGSRGGFKTIKSILKVAQLVSPNPKFFFAASLLTFYPSRSFDHPVRPRQHVGRNRLPILDGSASLTTGFRFWILRHGSGPVLDFRLSDRSHRIAVRNVFVIS
jgi:hypothetical protein